MYKWSRQLPVSVSQEDANVESRQHAAHHWLRGLDLWLHRGLHVLVRTGAVHSRAAGPRGRAGSMSGWRRDSCPVRHRLRCPAGLLSCPLSLGLAWSRGVRIPGQLKCQTAINCHSVYHSQCYLFRATSSIITSRDLTAAAAAAAASTGRVTVDTTDQVTQMTQHSQSIYNSEPTDSTSLLPHYSDLSSPLYLTQPSPKVKVKHGSARRQKSSPRFVMESGI